MSKWSFCLQLLLITLSICCTEAAFGFQRQVIYSIGGIYPTWLAMTSDNQILHCVDTSTSSWGISTFTVSPTGTLSFVQRLASAAGQAALGLFLVGDSIYVPVRSPVSSINSIVWLRRNLTTSFVTLAGIYQLNGTYDGKHESRRRTKLPS